MLKCFATYFYIWNTIMLYCRFRHCRFLCLPKIDIISIIMSVLNWHKESFNSTYNVSSLEISDLIWLKLISTHCSTLQSCGSTWVILGVKTTCNYPVIGFKTTPILSSILLHTHWYDLFDDGVSNFLGFFSYLLSYFNNWS